MSSSSLLRLRRPQRSLETVLGTQAMVLREATHDDIATLVALIHTAFEEYRGRLEPPSGRIGKRPRVSVTICNRAVPSLAWLKGQVVGCVCYHQEGQHVYFGRLSVRLHAVTMAWDSR